jgi:hypothetical protein
MQFNQLITYLWMALGLLFIGSVYLIIEGYKVHKLFAESVVGRLVKSLVVVLIIEVYSLGIVLYYFLTFYTKGLIALIPIVFLLLVSLAIAVFSIRSAKKEVVSLIK